MAWLTGWDYRKSHEITGTASGDQTNYQVGIKVYYTSGADGTETVTGIQFGKVYLDSKCETNFDDIRFTADDGTTLLDYWIESKTDSNNAIVWIEIPSIPVSPNTVDIYIYYGNSSATSDSDGIDTFLKLFDHFLGDSLDTNIWLVNDSAGTLTISGSIAKVEGGEPNLRYAFSSKSPYEDEDPAALRFRALVEATVGSSQITQIGWTRWGATAWALIKSAVGSHEAQTRDSDGNIEYDVIGSGYFNSYFIYEITRDGSLAKYRVDGTEVASGDMDPDTETFGAQLYVRDSEYDIYCDWILIREWAPTEPTHTSWGEEEEEEVITGNTFRITIG